MNLSRNFTLSELIKSDTAIRKGINNNPNAKAEAADFEVIGTSNAELADWIYKNLQPDQLILEFFTPGEPNSGWIHCSWVAEQPRKQFLHAFKSEGKTKYKPVIGKAVDIV